MTLEARNYECGMGDGARLAKYELAFKEVYPNVVDMLERTGALNNRGAKEFMERAEDFDPDDFIAVVGDLGIATSMVLMKSDEYEGRERKFLRKAAGFRKEASELRRVIERLEEENRLLRGIVHAIEYEVDYDVSP